MKQTFPRYLRCLFVASGVMFCATTVASPVHHHKMPQQTCEPEAKIDDPALCETSTVNPVAVVAPATPPAEDLVKSPLPVPVTVVATPEPVAVQPVAPASELREAPVAVPVPVPVAAAPLLAPPAAMDATTIEYPEAFTPKPLTFASVAGDLEMLFGRLKHALPALPPLADETFLPTLKKVYPTGEKPLYVLTFKCPTELIGIVPPPIKVLHWLVSSGMDAINSSNLLPFNMQQVCQ